MAILNEGNRKPKVPAFAKPSTPVTPSDNRRRDLREMEPTEPKKDYLALNKQWAKQTLGPLFRPPQPLTNNVRRDFRDMGEANTINPSPLTRDQRERYPFWQTPPTGIIPTQRAGRVGPHQSGALLPPATGGGSTQVGGYNFMDSYQQAVEDRKKKLSQQLAPGGGSVMDAYNYGLLMQEQSQNNYFDQWKRRKGGGGTTGGSGWGGGWGGGGWGGGGWGSSGWGSGGYSKSQYEYPPNMGLFSWNFKG